MVKKKCYILLSFFVKLHQWLDYDPHIIATIFIRLKCIQILSFLRPLPFVQVAILDPYVCS